MTNYELQTSIVLKPMRFWYEPTGKPQVMTTEQFLTEKYAMTIDSDMPNTENKVGANNKI